MTRGWAWAQNRGFFHLHDYAAFAHEGESSAYEYIHPQPRVIDCASACAFHARGKCRNGACIVLGTSFILSI